MLNGHRLVDWEFYGENFLKIRNGYSIVKNASSIILKEKNDDSENSILAEQLIEYVSQRDKFMLV